MEKAIQISVMIDGREFILGPYYIQENAVAVQQIFEYEDGCISHIIYN